LIRSHDRSRHRLKSQGTAKEGIFVTAALRTNSRKREEEKGGKRENEKRGGNRVLKANEGAGRD